MGVWNGVDVTNKNEQEWGFKTKNVCKRSARLCTTAEVQCKSKMRCLVAGRHHVIVVHVLHKGPLIRHRPQVTLSLWFEGCWVPQQRLILQISVEFKIYRKPMACYKKKSQFLSKNGRKAINFPLIQFYVRSSENQVPHLTLVRLVIFFLDIFLQHCPKTWGFRVLPSKWWKFIKPLGTIWILSDIICMKPYETPVFFHRFTMFYCSQHIFQQRVWPSPAHLVTFRGARSMPATMQCPKGRALEPSS